MGEKRHGSDSDVIDRALVNEGLRLWRALEVTDAHMTRRDEDGYMIESISIRGPELAKGGYMAVIKVKDELGGRYVAFRSAGTLRELMAKVGEDIDTGKLQLKDDRPWVPPDKQTVAPGA
jgi:hypothetical protein